MTRRLTSLVVIITLMGILTPPPGASVAAQPFCIPLTGTVSETISGSLGGPRTIREAAAVSVAALLLALGPVPASGNVVSGLVCDTNGNARFGELADKASGVASIVGDGEGVLVRVKVSGLPPQTPMACRLTCANPGEGLQPSPCGTTTTDGKLTGTAHFLLQGDLQGRCVAPAVLVHREGEPREVCVSGVRAPTLKAP
jgi:hypothetical protein